jgi:pantoate--beta-alanine ligase
MGAFHDGHRSLFAAARTECATVVVSLFVNPAQFSAGEDFAAYPRGEATDAAAAEAAGVDVLFVPTAEVIYPPGFDTWVDPGALGAVLEGAVRPGHFRGVATVCLKLFHLASPDRVYFGRKDAQQVAVIRNLLRDLDLAPRMTLRVLPTVRDADGLALSSRNGYLSPEERREALALPSALEAGLAAHRRGADPAAAALAVLNAESGLTIDYAAVADLDGPTLAAAVHVGRTRLIDNVRLEGEDAAGGG